MSNDQTKTAYETPLSSILHPYSQYSDCLIIFLLILLLLATLGLGDMISDLYHLCYHHYIYVLDPILQVIVTYYV